MRPVTFHKLGEPHTINPLRILSISPAFETQSNVRFGGGKHYATFDESHDEAVRLWREALNGPASTQPKEPKLDETKIFAGDVWKGRNGQIYVIYRTREDGSISYGAAGCYGVYSCSREAYTDFDATLLYRLPENM